MKKKIHCCNKKCNDKIPKKFSRLVHEDENGIKKYICANCAIEALIKVNAKLQEKLVVQDKREAQRKAGNAKLILPR